MTGTKRLRVEEMGTDERVAWAHKMVKIIDEKGIDDFKAMEDKEYEYTKWSMDVSLAIIRNDTSDKELKLRSQRDGVLSPNMTANMLSQRHSSSTKTSGPRDIELEVPRGNPWFTELKKTAEVGGLQT